MIIWTRHPDFPAPLSLSVTHVFPSHHGISPKASCREHAHSQAAPTPINSLAGNKWALCPRAAGQATPSHMVFLSKKKVNTSQTQWVKKQLVSKCHGKVRMPWSLACLQGWPWGTGMLALRDADDVSWSTL